MTRRRTSFNRCPVILAGQISSSSGLAPARQGHPCTQVFSKLSNDSPTLTIFLLMFRWGCVVAAHSSISRVLTCLRTGVDSYTSLDELSESLHLVVKPNVFDEPNQNDWRFRRN